MCGFTPPGPPAARPSPVPPSRHAADLNKPRRGRKPVAHPLLQRGRCRRPSASTCELPLLQHGLSPSPGGRASAGHPNRPNLPTINAVQPAGVGLGSCGPQGRRGTAPFHSSQVSTPPAANRLGNHHAHTLGRALLWDAPNRPLLPVRLQHRHGRAADPRQNLGTQHVRLAQPPPRLAAFVGAARSAPSGMLTSVCYATHAPGYTCRPATQVFQATGSGRVPA